MEKDNYIPFNPFFLISGSHPQTIFGAMLVIQRHPESINRLITLPDGDKISLEISIPENWRETDPTVFMLHGLCGSHKSPYLVRMTKKLLKKGFRCIRMNLRGCGSGKGYAKKVYHGGQSEDVYEVIKILARETPFSKTTLMGFSLGGAILLKLAGELGYFAGRFFDQVIAVNPPIDLYSSVDLLRQPKNQIYERFFSKMLRDDIDYRRSYFNQPKIKFSKNAGIFEIDSLCTAPSYGFSDVMEYYQKQSAKSVLPNIGLPAKILI